MNDKIIWVIIIGTYLLIIPILILANRENNVLENETLLMVVTTIYLGKSIGSLTKWEKIQVSKNDMLMSEWTSVVEEANYSPDTVIYNNNMGIEVESYNSAGVPIRVIQEANQIN